MKGYPIVIGVAALAIIVALWVVNVRTAEAPGPQACTADAKVCPDGSAVGRTGPNCEFAQCPTPTTTTGPVSLQARIDQEVNGLGVRITPLEVLEDSRCPIDVQCIQAGTVRIKARLVSGLGTVTQEFKLGQPITTEAEEVTLTDVSPAPKAGVKIQDSAYVFTFTIAKRTSSTLPPSSGVRGTVLLGPTCPVMRDPPDPQCADKPYATAITVYRTDSNSVLATGKSDTEGAFEFSLPSGSYTLIAAGGTTLPRCSETNVAVVANTYVTATISCDTGIR